MGRWGSIKHKKAASDAKRGVQMAKASREIISAAKQGGGDVNFNVRLRTAVERAKAIGLPNAKIENAINNSIRKQLPFKKMIAFYLNEHDKDSIPSDLLSSDLSVSESYEDDSIHNDVEDMYKSDEEELDEISQELTTALENDDVVIKDEDDKEAINQQLPEPVDEEKEVEPEVQNDKPSEVKDEVPEAEVEIEPVKEDIVKNENVEEIVVDEPEKKSEPEETNYQEEMLIEEDNEEAPVQKIVENDKLDAKLNIMPPEKKKEEILEESYDDEDIKKIKISTTDKKKNLIFFEDAESD